MAFPNLESFPPTAGASTSNGTDDSNKKDRKPYTITKLRESWTNPKHEKFLEALHLFPKLVQSINCKSSKSWHFALHRSIQFSPFQNVRQASRALKEGRTLIVGGLAKSKVDDGIELLNKLETGLDELQNIAEDKNRDAVAPKQKELLNYVGGILTTFLQVNDLRHLLGLYAEWHSRLIPYYSFDQFVHNVEQVRTTNRVRRCIRELRGTVAHGEDPAKLHESQVQQENPGHDQDFGEKTSKIFHSTSLEVFIEKQNKVWST
ncbi:unnamed protein product [Fraxinus pennsylvanica]|uniref:Uncharacterized protein n=1 Tax=Fraxinus pennsylvanica TaxID=56036 RepID=A0AAD1ZWK1_9LAMI|nr:unnamed protein product [Fraxinus pennsylvanica]